MLIRLILLFYPVYISDNKDNNKDYFSLTLLTNSFT